MSGPTEWSTRAACRTVDPWEMFVPARARERRQSDCLGCPVQIPCLAHALDNRITDGIFGGWSQRERRALLRMAPAVSSWSGILEAAGTDFEKAAALAQQQRCLPWLSSEEEAAFTAVFRARFVPLVAFLIKAGGSRQDAEDAVQSACVELAETWRRVECPEPWLRTTAYRMWLKSVYRIRPDELTEEIPESPANDHSDDVAEKLAMVQLLRRLPLLQRTVMAFEFDGCEPSETAEALGVPAANVRQNLRRARQKLERLLDEDAGGGQ
ncbi:sigma-70 family RNA polymerase sigma factor [Streptomyces cyaneochromogenes]|uniref:Transcriptional regulator WhiB n=1 Tax=Streptomyces cyaneochromogenes TaxID=2496836 RepID=A0A3S9LYX9_9ACTN|nr:sigma-70 family RNA polymerase sigma factor [Streptomyces cyaneochromogenes]AZQ32148.1 sigma-70 family RNA polymerase sigma factor [Streptomyces cyaneochromogenes]